MATGNRIKQRAQRSATSPSALNAELSLILDRFNDALSVTETAARAFETVDAVDAPGIGDPLCTLAQSVILLRQVYSNLDLTITRLSKVPS